MKLDLLKLMMLNVVKNSTLQFVTNNNYAKYIFALVHNNNIHFDIKIYLLNL